MDANMNMKELNLEDMESVNGGWSWLSFGGGLFTGGTLGGMTAGIVAMAVSGPVGWAVLGGAAVGAAVLGTVAGVEECITSEQLSGKSNG